VNKHCIFKEPTKLFIYFLVIINYDISLILSASACTDKSSYCSSYKDYCNEDAYKAYLEENCRATCNLCGKVFTPTVQS